MGPDLSKVQNLLDKLGKHKTGKGCLYINKLTDITVEVYVELGRVVLMNKRKNTSSGPNSIILNTSGLESGLYYINISNSDESIIKKVIKL